MRRAFLVTGILVLLSIVSGCSGDLTMNTARKDIKTRYPEELERLVELSGHRPGSQSASRMNMDALVEAGYLVKHGKQYEPTAKLQPYVLREEKNPQNAIFLWHHLIITVGQFYLSHIEKVDQKSKHAAYVTYRIRIKPNELEKYADSRERLLNRDGTSGRWADFEKERGGWYLKRKGGFWF